MLARESSYFCWSINYSSFFVRIHDYDCAHGETEVGRLQSEHVSPVDLIFDCLPTHSLLLFLYV